MAARAVVIGSGPNGLAAAIRLAEGGLDVTVLEAADAPGGAVRTEELTLPGFLHDTYSSVYPAGAASPVFGRMPLHDHGLRWVHPGACSAHPLEGGRAAALYRDLGETVASLDRVRAGDGEGWRRFAQPFVDHFDAVRATMLSGFPPVRGPLKLLTQLGPLGAARFGLLVPGSAQGLGRRIFQDGGTRAWLYAAAGHGDVPPDKPGSAVAAAYLNLLGHAVGWPSPEGGAGRLTGALVGYLQSLGGQRAHGRPRDRHPRDRRPGDRRRRPRRRRRGGRRGGGRRDAARARAAGRRRARRHLPLAACAATPTARPPSRSTGRSTARSRGRTPRCAVPAPSTSPAARTRSSTP